MYRIGEFSKIAQVSGRLLRWYDEIGLLSPDRIDSQTGYRYYSAQQLPRLNRILALKDLGLSLEQIAHVMARNTSAEEIRGMLMLRKAEIEQAIDDEKARLARVESRLKQIDSNGEFEGPDVVVKPVPAQQVLSLREVLPDIVAVKRRVQRVANLVPVSVPQSSLDHVVVVIHSPAYEPDALDVEIGYLLTGPAPKSVRLSEDRVLTLRELPAVENMATLLHVGPVNERHMGYNQLGAWIEKNQWKIADVGREVMMELPHPTPDDNAVMEIQFPVERADGQS